MKVARCIYFTDIGILSIVLDSVSSAHPWILRLTSSNEDTKAKSYVILGGEKNAFIWCNFGKDPLVPFWGPQGQTTIEVQIWLNPETNGSLVLQVTFKNYMKIKKNFPSVSSFEFNCLRSQGWTIESTKLAATQIGVLI